MKILIAYDGSLYANKAIQDLKNAGLPETGVQATVLSVGEVRTRTEPALNLEPAMSIIAYGFEQTQDILDYAREAAEEDSQKGMRMVQSIFPRWEVMPFARLHSPASTILEIAESWQPDLIAMGSHGRGPIKRMFLGSVSLRVATEAHTSVRIAKHEANPSNRVILLAFDGSNGASAAVRHLLERQWPRLTHLHIVSVIDVSILATPEYTFLLGSDLEQYQEQNETRIEDALHSLEREMQRHFDRVTAAAPVGNPAHEILAEAKCIGADTIFIGSRGLTGFEHILLGSVAHNVAAHAEATVEIARGVVDKITTPQAQGVAKLAKEVVEITQ